MSTGKRSPRPRGYRPAADLLETRQLLSGVVTGNDIDGDAWSLRLIGPGNITVVKQDDATGNPAPLNSATEIRQIIVGGTLANQSKLIGQVKKGPNGDGKVFFQQMQGIPGRSQLFPSVGDSLKSVDMPGFWLGNTTPGTTPGTPTITLPDGAGSFRFGGVDTTHNRPAATSSTQSDQAVRGGPAEVRRHEPDLRQVDLQHAAGPARHRIDHADHRPARRAVRGRRAAQPVPGERDRRRRLEARRPVREPELGRLRQGRDHGYSSVAASARFDPLVIDGV
ncbi:MAG: hypothetical protein U0835_06510 [Isosphaeraceae bacterium]